VEWVADLEAQRVSRAEAAGNDASLEDRVPERDCVVGRAAELAASLACIAGAGDEAANPQHLVLPERERLELDPEALEGFRPLNGQKRPFGRDILHLVERAVVGVDVGRVDDEQVVVRPAAVDDEVVHDPAALVR
jgi:hypothetical protein